MEVAEWLRRLGLERYQEAFRENDVSDTILPSLTAEDLKDIGVALIRIPNAILAPAPPKRNPQTYPWGCPSGTCSWR